MNSVGEILVAVIAVVRVDVLVAYSSVMLLVCSSNIRTRSLEESKQTCGGST